MPSEQPTLKLGELPRLAVRRPDGKEVHHWLAIREITIGRSLTNRVCIPDPHVSKFHAKLFFSENSITLTDLGSTNKTRVNGTEVSETHLAYGDFIQIAHVECRILPPHMQTTQPPRGKVEATEQTVNVSPSALPPVVAAAPVESQRISAAPPRVRSPLFRLYLIGGVLILISLLMALGLRIMLTPAASDTTVSTEAEVGIIASPEVEDDGVVSPTAHEPEVPFVENRVEPGRTVEFYFDEALSFTATGRLKAARVNFEKILEIDPNHRRAKSRLALLDEQIEEAIEAHFTKARQAFQFLRYDEAISEWEMVMELADTSDPRHEEAMSGIEKARSRKR
jgi:pSer/pThr/pTyr-binding forkhead associated (FHA) protein